MFDELLHYTKAFLLKKTFLMFLSNFIFLVSHLKIPPGFPLNSLRALTSL